MIVADVSKGLEKLKSFIKTLPSKPGVYRMVDANGLVLYVGKAKNLLKRVTSYTQIGRLNTRLQHMVNQIDHVEIIITASESEALLLENNLIKTYNPPYNVLLRDDKSFPYIVIGSDHPYPQILKYRGAKTKKGRYFGPYASSASVNETLTILQKAFLLRSCNDSVFEKRDRPCLLYQIKRCSAPCVSFISKVDYAELVQEATDFLKGHSTKIQSLLAVKMQEASDKLDYEQAKVFRDRIRALTTIQAEHFIHGIALGEEVDVIAIHPGLQLSAIQVFFYRNGQNLGNVSYFFSHLEEWKDAELMESFLSQFYEARMPPKEILVSVKPENLELITNALSQKLDQKVKINHPEMGPKKNLVDHALQNAKEALTRKQIETKNQDDMMLGLRDRFGLDFVPRLIEVYDNSHISGTHAIGVMICADKTGFLKANYRKFNMGMKSDLTPGDDYAMMREVFQRRFQRLLKEDPDKSLNLWPDLVLIDGGKGQLSSVEEVFHELGIQDVQLMAIAKGKERNKGREDFFLPGREGFKLDPKDPVLYFVQRLRDEAHRFAIGSHRQKRETALSRSQLDLIEGVGPKRKKALLIHFGSVKEIAKASLADLKKVEGISQDIAEKIHIFFHK